jgi:hypothetical protein
MDPGQKAAKRKGFDPNTGLGLGEGDTRPYYSGKNLGFFEMPPREHRPKKMPKANRSAGNAGGTRKKSTPVPFATGKTPYETRSGNKRARTRF